MRKIVNLETGEVTYADDAPVVQEDVVKTRRAEILSSLNEIDRKSIRAIREGDSVRITQWETQAAALRAELAGL